MHTLKVFLQLCKLNFQQLLIYRVSFFITLVLMTFWVLAYVVLTAVIFSHTDTLAGYTQGQVLLVLAFYYLFQNLSDIFYKDSFEQFGEQMINRGLLDFSLVKPISTRLLAFFNRIRFDHCAGLFITAALFIYAIRLLPEPLSLLAFLMGIIYSLLATVLYWNILSIVVTFAFWVTRNDTFRGLIWNFSQISRYPRQIYKTAVMKFFTFVLPFTVLASVPAEVALRLQKDHIEWYVIGLTLLFSFLSHWFWKAGLKRYTSAA